MVSSSLLWILCVPQLSKTAQEAGPITIYIAPGISVPTEYVSALSAKPRLGFTADQAETPK